MLLVARCSDRGAGSKTSALHSPTGRRAVLRALAGQLLGFEVQKRVIMSVRTEKLATWNPSKWGRQRKAGGHKIKKTKTKNKQGKKGKNI